MLQNSYFFNIVMYNLKAQFARLEPYVDVTITSSHISRAFMMQDIDAVMSHVGEFSKWHLGMLAILWLPAMNRGIHTYTQSFTSKLLYTV